MDSAGRSLRGRKTAQGRSGGTSPSRSGALSSSKFGNKFLMILSHVTWACALLARLVAAGGTHSVVLTQEGHVWTWGQPWPPGDIKKISTPVRVQGLEHVSMIAVGAFHNLALSEDGILWAWGNNEYGQLGIGDTQPRSQPIRVEGLSDLSLVRHIALLLLVSDILSKLSGVDIAAGGWHSAALTKDGESMDGVIMAVWAMAGR
ncbi:hypothetical protein ACQ4PT_020751 [Festuca glaucescens]